MRRFVIWYEETYGREYFVDAENPEEAKHKLYNDIFDGKERGPEECVGCEFRIVDEINNDI